MDLHAIAAGAIAPIHPMVPLIIFVSDGSTTTADGTRVPSYRPSVTRLGDVQNLTYRDLAQLDGMNQQGIRRAIYISGRVDGLIRSERKGGDLIQTPDGASWLVVEVLEYWPTWCKVAVTLQRAAPTTAEANVN